MLEVLLFSLAAAGGPDPRAVLAKVKEATGGPAWDRITSTHAKVILETGGFKGSAEAWEDVCTGRAVSTYILGPLSGANGTRTPSTSR